MQRNATFTVSTNERARRAVLFYVNRAHVRPTIRTCRGEISGAKRADQRNFLSTSMAMQHNTMHTILHYSIPYFKVRKFLRCVLQCIVYTTVLYLLISAQRVANK